MKPTTLKMPHHYHDPVQPNQIWLKLYHLTQKLYMNCYYFELKNLVWVQVKLKILHPEPSLSRV